MQLTNIDIHSLIEKGERLRVECKEALGGLPETLWNSLPDDEFLTKIGAAKRVKGSIRPTLAGLICFGDFNLITDVLPHFFLDYRERLSDETRWSDRVCAHDATWSGNTIEV